MYHYNKKDSAACMICITYSLVCIEEDLGVVELIVLCILDGVVSHSVVHLGGIANEPWRGGGEGKRRGGERNDIILALAII